MPTRYVVPCAGVLVLALLVALVVYRLTPVTDAASCTFRDALPASSTGTNTDAIAAQAERAANAVAEAGRADIYSGPARAAGVDPGTLAAGTTVTQLPLTATFTLQVTNDNPDLATGLANRMCDSYVARLSSQDAQRRTSESDGLRDKIASLNQAISALQTEPAEQRTPADQALLAAQQQAAATDQAILAQVLALPPDDITVVTRSAGAVRSDTRSLGRNLLVAGAAGLLACFLVVLAGELYLERRPSREE
ncbi:MAG TPA: hypothetical protein VFO60_02590 [Candidatus Dormibacteraeota bacterium]|nr:hypothetical protein [Candidatus Dormibacteraeota bacterium]